MTHKKVINSDAGTADIFGGNDLDKWSDYASGVDVDDYDINSDTQYRYDKFQIRNSGNTFGSKLRSAATAARITTLPDWDTGLALGGYSQAVFKDGSTYYAIDRKGTILNSSTTNPGAVIQSCLDLQGKTYVAAGDYTLGASFAGVNIHLNFTTLELDTRAKLIVPDGYTGYVIKIQRGATNVGNLRQCHLSGGELNEASGVSGSHLWTGVKVSGGPLTNQGVGFCSLRNMFIEYCGTGVAIDCTLGWANGNMFDSITSSGCQIGFDFIAPSPVNLGNASCDNLFSQCCVQDYDSVPSVYGFKNVRYKDQVFVNCKVWDFEDPATQKVMTIHGDAKHTHIIGGIMSRNTSSTAGEYFEDASRSTFISADEWNAPKYAGLTLTQNIFGHHGRKIGRQDMAGLTAGDGLLGGGMSTYTTETVNSDSLSFSDGHAGRLRTTAATINTGCGSRSSAAVTIRGYNPIYKCMFKLNQTAHTRPFFGWSSASVDCLANDDPLNVLSGVVLCARSTDTNFQIGSNDGVGSTVFTDTGIAKDTAMRVFELVVVDRLANKFRWALYTVADLESITSTLPLPTELATAQIPAQTTVLKPYFQMTNSEAATKSMIQYQLYLETD